MLQLLSFCLDYSFGGLMTAVIYARYSSHAQKDVSIEQQVEECREYAQQNNYTITAVYADRHTSGRSDRRPEFQRMMRDADKRRFAVVIAGTVKSSSQLWTPLIMSCCLFIE